MYESKKAAAILHVTDSQGRPAALRKLHIEQTDHDFLFDHPLVEAFTIWDFADGAWLGAPSGVIRKDNSRKPS